MNGFKQFLLRGNVVDLAVGIVIGAAFSGLIGSLVKDIIAPFIGSFGGQPDFSAISFTINNSKFTIGLFINAIISFLISASVIYFFVVLPMNKLVAKAKKGETIDPTTKKCSECLSDIPLAAKKCAFCTSVVSV